LIVVGKHYKDGAGWDNEYFSSGEMTPEEHFQYLRFTLDAMADLYRNNRHIKYVTIFQNWLQPAGASFDHPHKQLVGLDEWGATLQREMDMAQDEPNLYNRALVNFAWDHNLVFAENDHAIALAEIGHPYPTLGVYSKSSTLDPSAMPEEELRGFSDLLHACHAAMGSQVPCNEEWYYHPPEAPQAVPWRVLIKWRTVNPAGFEGGTRIFINPVSPVRLRDRMVPRLYELRDLGKIANLRVALECRLQKDALRYHRG
jgi:galactose-1-phosphate uridylyltransferase